MNTRVKLDLKSSKVELDLKSSGCQPEEQRPLRRSFLATFLTKRGVLAVPKFFSPKASSRQA